MSAAYIERPGIYRASHIHPRSAYASPCPRRGNRLPDRWREHLPDPEPYYRARITKIGVPNARGWAACRCPFHQDKHASASVNLESGAFRCHGCGARGDLMRFHMKLTGLGFKQAVTDLLEIKS